MDERVVLGVDPGTLVAGYGVIKVSGQRAALIDSGALIMSSKDPIQVRIERFYSFFAGKIIEHGVTSLALETPFLGKNAQNFLKLGYMRGVLLLNVQQHKLALHEFSPRQVKAAVTGYGHAEKEQVARVIARLFPHLPPVKHFDVSDAIAVALCGVWQK